MASGRRPRERWTRWSRCSARPTPRSPRTPWRLRRGGRRRATGSSPSPTGTCRPYPSRWRPPRPACARTAAAVARRVGVLDGAGAVVTGAELARLDDAALVERVAATPVYARTSPEQKLRIVTAWKARGAVVAMTGDGVNDAPALRRADIGVAMGVAGTDVSREAADMVLADDDFATIVAAVEEGRRIYDNIRRFVRYLLTTNSGEIWVMFLASLVALPVPLLPVQILWVNLVTDGLPAIALGLEPAERASMRRPPRPPDESILGRGLWQHALWVGLTMAAVCLSLLAAARAASWP